MLKYPVLITKELDKVEDAKVICQFLKSQKTGHVIAKTVSGKFVVLRELTEHEKTDELFIKEQVMPNVRELPPAENFIYMYNPLIEKVLEG